MEAEFITHYLGSSMLTKGTTGLGVIQKPLREKYFSFRKSADNRLGPEIIVRINPSGILMIFPGPKPGQESEEFYELPSVHFIEAVHFVTLRQKDKKFYGAFVPIEEGSSNASQEKLFVQIDKKMNHLTKISHPPMLALVMRRPTGVKAVDCHMLVVPVIEDALRMADMVHRFQEHPVNRNYEGYGGPPPHHIRRENSYPEPDVIPRDQWPRDPARDDGGERNSREDYEIYRGDRLELRQEHFRRNEKEIDPRFPNNRSFDSDRSGDKDRSFERMSGERFRGDEGPRYPPPLGPRDEPVVRRPRELRTTNGVFVERDSVGHEYEFDNVINHERQSSGGDRDPRWMAERGGLSPRGSDRGGLSPRADDYNRGLVRTSGEYGRYDRSPQIEHREPDWAARSGGGYRGRDPPYAQPTRPGGDPRMMSSRERSPPRGPSMPRSPRSRSPEEEVYSASNLESRQEADQSGKPVAKVPPHRHAGIRVLPSLPIAGVKQLKHVTPKSEPSKDAKEDNAPKYNFDTRQDYQNEDEMESPYDNNVGLHSSLNNNNDKFRKDRFYSDNSEVETRGGSDVMRNSGNRVKSDGYNYNYEQHNNKPAVTRPWTFEEEKEKFLRKDKENRDWNGGYKGRPTHDSDADRYESEYSSGRSQNGKDAEIADLFSNLNTGNMGPREVDFEQSLGYLP